MNTAAAELDLGPLTWVKGEIDHALERALEALERHGKEGVEAGHLQSARNHLHQAHGALTIVGLDGITRFSESVEQLLQSVEDGEVAFSPAVADAARQGIDAIRHYLEDLLAGQPDQPLRLLPAYRSLAAARGQPEPAPSDLFFPDLSLRPPRREHEPEPTRPAEAVAKVKAARLGFQRGLLKWLRNDPGGLAEMRQALADVESTQSQPAVRAFWWVALGFVDALAAGPTKADVAARRLCARIDIQIKRFLEGSRNVAERLMRDALYFVATAGNAGDHVECVRAAYRLAEHVPKMPSAAEMEPLKPLLRACREQLAATMDDWNRFCAGTAAALPQFHDRIRHLAGQLPGLRHKDITRLTETISTAADALRKSPLSHNESVGLEMATTLLLLDNALEGFQRLGGEFAGQVSVAADRLNAALRGEMLGSIETPHLDEMSRKAQEKLLMSQVVKEIQANLAAIEQTLDAFFRDPGRTAELADLGKPLKQIEGALMVLGQDRAVAVLRDCEAVVEGFRAENYQPSQDDFEDVAAKLSALGFFVDKLQFGNADIDAILSPNRSDLAHDAHPSVEAELAEVRRQAQSLVEALKEQPEDAGLRGEIKQNLEALRDGAQLVDDRGLADKAAAALAALDQAAPETELAEAVAQVVAPAPAAAAPSADALRLAEASSEQIDAELLEIFIEEARDVLATLGNLLPTLSDQPHDVETMTTIRRSFHTLKGSGRMVGLGELGEAAWAVEQVYNRWLQNEREATPALMAMTGQAHGLFQGWVEQLAGGGSVHRDAAALVAACDALKQDAEAASPPPLPPPSVPAAPAGPWMEPAITVETVEAAEPPPVLELEFPPAEPEGIRIGDLTLSPTLYDLYINEARSHVVTLARELGHVGVPQPALVRAAHTLAGISATTGLVPVNLLAHAVENALNRLAGVEATPTESQHLLLARAVGALEGMVGAIAERRWPGVEDALATELDALSPSPGALAEAITITLEPEPAPMAETTVDEVLVMPEPEITIAPVDLEAPSATARPNLFLVETEAPATPAPAVVPMAAPEPPHLEVVPAPAVEESAHLAIPAPLPESVVPEAEPEHHEAPDRRHLRLQDELDPQLLPIFLEEGVELMQSIGDELRAWHAQPDNLTSADRLKRLLHTFKGSARMAGAMSLGELVHSMESRIEQAVATRAISDGFLDGLDNSLDRAAHMMEVLQGGGEALAEVETAAEPAPLPGVPTIMPAVAAPVPAPAPAGAATVHPVAEAEAEAETTAKAMLRVRAEVIDNLVNEAGEIAIARGRIEGEMRSLKSSLLDLTENVIRLRNQLREIEIQAESQLQSRQALAADQELQFDPLEFDRFTRFQELTRMMAESVNDVATSQQTLLQNLDHADSALTAQARLNRELSQALMGVRMVPFNTLADRLYRVVRQTAKELGKRANLDIRGGQSELDRSVLEKMTGPLEHLLRNAIAHGLETPEQRAATNKPPIGEIGLRVAQEGNEVVIEMADDGAGLDFPRIREIGIERGLLAADAHADNDALTQLIFQPGFSTATELSAVAGRGVGMDVVKSEAASLGGRIEVESTTGHGTRFRVYLPLTLAVTQAVLVRVASRHYAIPSSMVAQVNELKPDAMAAIRAQGGTSWLGETYPWHFLPHLLGDTASQPEPMRRHWLLLLRSGMQRVALEVDELVGNQEVVVKNIGAQLARVVGISGATVLGDGEVALILNPIALAGREVKAVSAPALPTQATAAPTVSTAGLVMVVDDSLTVRKITGRLLAREGYHVITAKDGVDALEQLLDVVPDVMLVDIEMPRMDGFDLTRNVRADERLRKVPIIMITSRTAEKHRNYAREIGVNHYLGKPYDEDELLKLISGYAHK